MPEINVQYSIQYTNQFKKSVKLARKRGLDISLLENVIDTLAAEGCLPPEYKPHILSGKYDNVWECHIKPDWLLLWEQEDSLLTLVFLDTGTHSDIF